MTVENIIFIFIGVIMFELSLIGGLIAYEIYVRIKKDGK